LTSFKQTETYLYSLHRRGMKFGLRNIRALLAHAGNPHLSIKTIHVAGTNGKGSTSSFIASILMESGLRTGLYTSPHLVRFSERIRIDGREIRERRIVEYVGHLRPAVEEMLATFFEATTCVAFQYFADEGVDVAVIETGLGGRLDATNVLNPLVSVITSLSMDHVEILGPTIGSIAREKGGIIKPGIPCVTSARNTVALRVLDRIAGQRRTKVYRSWRDVKIVPDSRAGHDEISLRGRDLWTEFFLPGLAGEHQRENAQLAVRTCEILRRTGVSFASRITGKSVERGLRRVRANTGLRGRRERVRYRGVPMLLDVGHNVDGVRVLADSLKGSRFESPVVIFGVLREKDGSAMIRTLATIASHIVGVVPSTARALRMDALTRIVRQFPVPFTRGGSVRKGLQRALRLAKGRPLLVTGSHYVVGEVITLLEKDR